MFKFEYNGVVYTAETVEALQEVLQNAGIDIDMSFMLDEQQEILDEVLDEQQEIVDEQYQEILNDKITDNKLN